MNTTHGANGLGEKHVNNEPAYNDPSYNDPAYHEKRVSTEPAAYDPESPSGIATSHNVLHRELKGRHMQMIAM